MNINLDESQSSKILIYLVEIRKSEPKIVILKKKKKSERIVLIIKLIDKNSKKPYISNEREF